MKGRRQSTYDRMHPAVGKPAVEAPVDRQLVGLVDARQSREPRGVFLEVRTFGGRTAVEAAPETLGRRKSGERQKRRGRQEREAPASRARERGSRERQRDDR